MVPLMVAPKFSMMRSRYLLVTFAGRLFILSSFLGVANGALAGLPSIPVFAASSTTTSSEAAVAAAEMEGSPRKVAVCGSTGRTGRLVVRELLDRNIGVVALVRDTEKAAEALPSPGEDVPEGSLSIVECDLSSEDEIRSSVEGCDAAIWCATGFSDAPGSGILNKLKRLLGTALAPQQGIDAVGVPALAKCFPSSPAANMGSEDSPPLPKVIMLSSAGVTRPSWDRQKKEMFRGSAEIPIVRLNPFGILDIKAESEEKLRSSGVPYSIFRPAGLNENWPSGCRPVFSQGDVAVGRINRKDVAKILVDLTTMPEATGKTFEAFTLQGYQPAPSIAGALSRLRLDSEGVPPMEVISATYLAMQQLLPGEIQDAAALAMGQTYEELDRGKQGRLGRRGEEDAEAAAPKPS